MINSIPIPEGSIADKDAFLETLPEESLYKKELIPVKNKAKNIILLISDGMSLTQVSSYRLLKGGPNERIAVDTFPVSGIVLTHSKDAIVTDSASSATAFSTGKKLIMERWVSTKITKFSKTLPKKSTNMVT